MNMVSTQLAKQPVPWRIYRNLLRLCWGARLSLTVQKLGILSTIPLRLIQVQTLLTMPTVFWINEYGVSIIGHGGNTDGFSSRLMLDLESGIGYIDFPKNG